MLLERCLKDNNDEVRDRAGYLLTTLQSKDKTSTTKASIFSNSLPKFRDLEYSLAKYLEDGDTEEGFSLEKDLVELQVEEAPPEDSKGDLMDVVQAVSSSKDQENPYLAQLNAISDESGGSLIKALGPIFQSSSSPVELTESETEYVVNCVKHVYNRHVILQFNVTNTMEDQLLENISVEVEGDGPTSLTLHPSPVPISLSFPFVSLLNVDICRLSLFFSTWIFVVFLFSCVVSRPVFVTKPIHAPNALHTSSSNSLYQTGSHRASILPVGSWEEEFKIPIAELKPQAEDATFVCIQRPVSPLHRPCRLLCFMPPGVGVGPLPYTLGVFFINIIAI